MNQILQPIQGMKATLVLAVLILMITNISIAQATVASYNVTGIFFEPQTQPTNTTFNGSFEWDGASVTNLHGTMNSTMYSTDNINPDFSNTFPLLHLNNQLAQSVNSNIVTASVFLKATTDVFSGGGYLTGAAAQYGNGVMFGIPADGNTPIGNAYFTFAFDKTTMNGVLGDMVYADCTAGGMMGQFCMTGHSLPGGGTMAGAPLSLEITPVSAVPVPAAVWLFGSALAGLMGVSRKRA